MGVSSRTKGWRWDRTNDRLDFYYNGTRIGHIDAGGVDLAENLTYAVNTIDVAAGTLDAAYDLGKEIAVDGTAVLLTGTATATDVLKITANTSASCIALTQAGAGADITGTATWSISKAGVAVFGAITGTTATLSGDIDMSASATGVADIILNANAADALSIRTSGGDLILFKTSTTALITITPALTVTGALTASAGITSGGNVGITGTLTSSDALTVSAGTTSAISSTNINLTGIVAITGAVTMSSTLVVSGNLTVTGDFNWGGSFTVDELILDSDGSVSGKGALPYVISDNTGDLTINAKSTKAVLVAINGSDEYTFNATDFIVATGNYVKFAGDTGIRDSSGNEVILVEAVGSATTYLNVKNANDSDIELECLGGVDKGFLFKNDQNETAFEISFGGTDAQHINVLGAVNGASPVIQSAGTTADMGIDFENSEGEELLQLVSSGTDIYHIVITSVASGVPIIACSDADVGIMFTEGSAEELLELGAVSSAINYLKISSAVSGAPPVIASAGTVDIGIDFENASGEEMLQLVSADVSVNHIVITSVAGATNQPIISSSVEDYGIMFTEGSATKEEILSLSCIAAAVDYIDIKSGTDAAPPVISTTGGSTDVDLLLTMKGAGPLVINNGTDPVIVRLMGAADGYNNEIQDANSLEILALQGVASAVCEIGISNATTGNPAILSAQGEANSNLALQTAGTGMITFKLGTVDTLAFHDTGITLAAENDTAGHPLYMQTEDGGGSAATTGAAGGAWEMRTGDGSAAGGTTNAGGAGAALTLVTGLGGIGTTTGNGGVGGAVAVTAGAGGASVDDASSIGGTGGAITLTAGAGGAATGGGTAGQLGTVSVGAGCFAMVVQTIDMANNPITLTRVPGTPAGTLLSGNILYVDPNGGNENLLLPHEADCTGLFLIVINTGGEHIAVQTDVGGAILTIEDTENGWVACDGTTWFGSVAVL